MTAPAPASPGFPREAPSEWMRNSGNSFWPGGAAGVFGITLGPLGASGKDLLEVFGRKGGKALEGLGNAKRLSEVAEDTFV